MRRVAISRLAVLACAALAGCGQPVETTVAGAWVRLPAVPRRPASAYFTLHGGAADMTLVSVTCENAIRSEMHESMGAGSPSTGSAPSMMGMRPIRDIPLPAHADLAFQPGGRHVMLFDLNPAIKPPRIVKLMLTFSNGTRIVTDATTVAAGDPAPA